jgi:protein-disulfide isomerase
MPQGTSKHGSRFDSVSTGILVLAAVTMVGFSVHDRWTRSSSPAPAFVDNWKSVNAQGILLGQSGARVTVTEFMDFQCPFCAGFVARADSLVAKFPNDVAVVVHHFPLGIHPHAALAAIAAECAGRQGRFELAYRALFKDQKSIGTRPWREYATEARVGNLAAFDRCMKLPEDSFPRIAYGREIGKRNGVRGTPTIWINGHAIGRTDMPGMFYWTRKLLKEAS